MCCHVSAVLVKSRTDSDTLHVLDDSIECNVYAEKGFRKRTSVFYSCDSTTRFAKTEPNVKRKRHVRRARGEKCKFGGGVVTIWFGMFEAFQ